MAKQQPESFYNVDKLHFVFAIIAVSLLLVLISVFVKDSNRGWKNYQREYLTYDIERTRVKYDAASNALMKNDEYKFLVDDLKKAQDDFKAHCATEDLLKSIDHLNTQRDLNDQEYKFAKAHFDAAQFSYDKAVNTKGADAKKAWQELDKYRRQKDDFKLKVEDLESQIKAKQNQINACSQQVKDLERKERVIDKQASLLERKLQKIDPDKMSFINRIANIIRDLPVLDLSNPKYKIEQVVISDITDDVKLKQIPKVERCTTCHKGITNPDFKNAPQPLTTHPDLELFLANGSAHPMEEFGCTVCHGGRGRGTSFNSAVHTPSSEEQAKEWKAKYGWDEFHHWEEPMLPIQHTQAGCFKCHSGQEWIKGGEKLGLGLQVIEKAGCYNCHVIKKYEGWPKSGPDLTHLASKVKKDWAYKWIMDPKSFRHNTWMPSYFTQSNNSDQDSVKRNQQEVHAIVAYLFANSTDFSMTSMASDASMKNGQKIVATAGCLACHQINPQEKKEELTSARLQREHGPNLIGFGSKTSKQWIYNWLKDPKRYHPETRMPNLRLTDQEASDVAEYLSTSDNAAFDQKTIPVVDDAVLNQIVFDFLSQSQTKKEADAKIAEMSTDEKLVYAGEKLIGHYGCFACHNIKGFENTKPIGPELTKVGNTDMHKVDLGFVHIEHSRDAWLKTKISEPRIFDTGKTKSVLEKSKMPNFNLSDEEAEAVTTALLGFVDESTVAKKKVKHTTQQAAIEAGQVTVRQFNCQACHKIEGQGGTILEVIKENLMKYDEKSESDAQNLVTTFGPPNLLGIGNKLQPAWMFEFIHDPSKYPVRPWLAIRMPTYGFSGTELNVLVKYFNALDQRLDLYDMPVDTTMSAEELDAAKKLFSRDYFNCTQCHIVGAKMPSGSGDNLAPNLAFAHDRLRPDWVIPWIKHPSEILPGTKMPTFYDPKSFDSAGPEDILGGDENAQIRSLRNFLMNITQHTKDDPAYQPAPPKAAEPEKKPEETDFWGQ